MSILDASDSVSLSRVLNKGLNIGVDAVIDTKPTIRHTQSHFHRCPVFNLMSEHVILTSKWSSSLTTGIVTLVGWLAACISSWAGPAMRNNRGEREGRREACKLKRLREILAQRVDKD